MSHVSGPPLEAGHDQAVTEGVVMLEGAIGRGRAFAETLMVDTCTITRRTGETTGAGGVITPTTSSVYSGKCRLQVRQETGAGMNVGEAFIIVQRLELQIPMTAPELFEGDRVVMTASVLDPQLVGRQYVVRDVVHKSHLTARRVTVLEVTS
jgi:hypothetical protein